ncbi:MAG: polyribonucleotide nucleotidyltransferase [Candidatus Sungbacteria bacterium]|nr:polyribonucleotide nucleotidyltransferase [Candidatus Sungbacteria bacterium]
MQSKKFSVEVGGKTLSAELTNLAGQAAGSIVTRIGDTMVLVTAVMAKDPREGGDFFPLTVEYEEKFYAAGKIFGSRFVKRETRPSEEAVLSGRLIDRTIRPRFDLRMRNEVQVIATVLSFDDQNDSDIPALIGASLALSTSNIPWDGPVAGVRVGKVNGNFVINPTFEERAASTLDLVVSGTESKINMLEAGASEEPEQEVLKAITLGHEEIKKIIAFEKEVISFVSPAKRPVKLMDTTGPLADALVGAFSKPLEEALWEKEKTARNAKIEALKQKWIEHAKTNFPEQGTGNTINYLWEEEIDKIVHKRIIENGERPDGRRLDEIRPLSADAGILPRVHGSGLFIRGETQALSTLTLGAPGDQLIIEGMDVRKKKRFIHHYNFPPYSVGEIKPMRGPGRREIGHGALAERALTPLIPKEEEFPYTMRIVSEILSSNGSSSMASVCGSILALMDAGVPLKKHAAGVAMGLMIDQNPITDNKQQRYAILTDIQGPEDHYGDMDLKVAGTKDGVTAIQMDVKIDGVNMEILEKTLEQARQGRTQVLDVLEKTLPHPRPELSPYAPRILALQINPEKIGALIGPGGKTINEIIAQTGAQIDIEDDGRVFVTADSKEALDKAVGLIKNITREIRPGELLEGKVTRLFEFGAMVEIGPRQEGLVHISELAPWRVERVSDIVKPGDIVPVLVKDVDEQGRVNLSLKRVPDRYTAEEIERHAADGGRPEHRNDGGPSRGSGHRPERYHRR